MDFKELFESKKSKQKELLEKTDAIDAERVKIINEILRLDGEIRLLETFIKEEKLKLEK